MTEVKIAESKRPKPQRRRVWPWVLFGVASLLVVGGVVGVLLLPSVLLRYIEKEAKAQGVVLTGCTVAPSLERLVLSSCAFELVGARGVSGTLGTVTVELESFEPVSVLVDGAAIAVRELPDLPTGELLPSWLERRAQLGKERKIPLRLENASLDLFGLSEQGESERRPLVSLSQLHYDSTTEAIRSDISIGGMIQGKFTHEGVRSELDVALVLSPATRARVSVETRAEAAEVRVEFEDLPLALFSIPPFIVLPEDLEAVQLDGQIYALVPFGLDTRGVHGDLRATARGLPLPVPREIQGLVYGPEVGIQSKFKVQQNHQGVELSALEVAAGALKLRGNAKIELRDARVPLEVRLSGSLSCGAILEAATQAHTDSPLALAAAKLARKAVKGGVGISVAIVADLMELPKAKVVRTIGVGCGLEPLPLPEELAALGDEFLKGLPPPPAVPDPPEFRLPELPRLEPPRLPDLRPRRNFDEATTPEAPASGAAP